MMFFGKSLKKKKDARPAPTIHNDPPCGVCGSDRAVFADHDGRYCRDHLPATWDHFMEPTLAQRLARTLITIEEEKKSI